MTQQDPEAAAAAIVGARLARERRNELTGLLAAHFARREPVQRAGKYIDALMSDLPDKNCWSLAQYAGDRMFMSQASQINLTEISLGRYVHAHASTATARNLGAIYARDHTAAQASLRALTSRLPHVTLPTTPGVRLESMVARVETQKGSNMDAAFARASVSGHQTAIAIFRQEERAGSNPAVKAYAARYLSTLRTHLRLAEHVESVLGVRPTG